MDQRRSGVSCVMEEMCAAQQQVASGARPVAAATGLAEVYEDHIDDLVRLAWLLTSSREAAHDICHDAFAAAHQRWSVIDAPVAYLRRCVVNGAADHHRRRGRERAVLERQGSFTLPTVEPDDEYLADLIAALPFRQQSAIVLRFWGGLTEAEIADAVGCRPGSVGPLLHRALGRLRAALATDPEEDSP